MSYALRLTANATADLQNLHPILAEDVLDELDRAAADPKPLRTDQSAEAIIDFDREIGGVRQSSSGFAWRACRTS